MLKPTWPPSIPFLLLYYAPVFIGAYRRRQAKAKSAPVWVLFLVDVLTGWTVIGWLYTLRLAFLDWEMPWENFRSGGGTFTQTNTGWAPPAASEPQRHACTSCGGSGGHYCSWCQGRGHWMENTTAMHCQQCGGSGKLQCQSCWGSGWVQG